MSWARSPRLPSSWPASVVTSSSVVAAAMRSSAASLAARMSSINGSPFGECLRVRPRADSGGGASTVGAHRPRVHPGHRNRRSLTAARRYDRPPIATTTMRPIRVFAAPECFVRGLPHETLACTKHSDGGQRAARARAASKHRTVAAIATFSDSAGRGGRCAPSRRPARRRRGRGPRCRGRWRPGPSSRPPCAACRGATTSRRGAARRRARRRASAVTTGTWNSAPADARTTFGFGRRRCRA